MEVVYTGIRQTPKMIAETALQEDVNVVGLSILSGAHLELFPKVINEMQSRGLSTDEILLFCGGIIPDEDISQVKDMGFHAVFGPGSDTRDVVDFINQFFNQ